MAILESLSTAGLIVIKNRKLLLAFSKNKNAWYLPGGKTDPGETSRDALVREINEELNIVVDADDLRYYIHISVQAFGEKVNTIMEQDCFFLRRSIIPQPSAEIGELKFFSLDDYLSEINRAPGAVMILELLQSDGLID